MHNDKALRDTLRQKFVGADVSRPGKGRVLRAAGRGGRAPGGGAGGLRGIFGDNYAPTIIA
jgi:hypothetical protein